MDRDKKKLLEQLLIWMEQDGVTFDDIAIPSKNLTYGQLYEEICQEKGYGAGVYKAFKRCIS